MVRGGRGVIWQNVGNWLVWAWTGLMSAASLAAALQMFPACQLQATPPGSWSHMPSFAHLLIQYLPSTDCVRNSGHMSGK